MNDNKWDIKVDVQIINDWTDLLSVMVCKNPFCDCKFVLTIELPKAPLKGKGIVTENVAVLNQTSKTHTWDFNLNGLLKLPSK